MSEIKEHLNEMVKKGHTEAKFGKLENATHFKKLIEQKLHIEARLSKILGHATTIDTHPSIKLTQHFHVTGIKSTAHNVLGKFL